MIDDAQMKIRLTRDLKERIEAAAKVGNRSLNAEIVLRLEHSFGDGDTFDHRINALSAEIENLRDRLRAVEATTWTLLKKGNSL